MSKMRGVSSGRGGTRSEKSTWTPKNYAPTNEKIFNERMALIKRWHAEWTEEQRWTLFEYILQQLNDNQLLLLHSLLHPSVPPPDHDFTRILPRFLCLKIFSLLDPQSLCRAAQVCWYWKYLTEANTIWRNKCLRLGWFLPAPPPPLMHDSTLWKRHYIACVSQLHWNPPQPPESGETDGINFMNPSEMEEPVNKKTRKKHGPRHVADKIKKPWRDPDPHPSDTHFSFEMDPNSLLYARFPYLRTGTKKEYITPQRHPTLPDSILMDPSIPPPTALLHPTLLEKMRLGSPSPAQKELSTLNKHQTENEISETFYTLHNTSPFPHLPPYFVHRPDKMEQTEEKEYTTPTSPREKRRTDLNAPRNQHTGRPPSGRSGTSIITPKSSISSSVQVAEGLLSKAWQIPDEEDDYR